MSSGVEDADVQKQIDHMVSFIQNEAKEKAEEIDTKAEEEFNIEKVRLVQQEKKKIIQLFERKEKQVEVQKKIAHSNELNLARLRLLKSQDSHLEEIFKDARSQLAAVTLNKPKYQALLKSLLTQGLLTLLESEVSIRGRAQDKDLLKGVIEEASKEYTKLSKLKVTITYDDSHSLPDSSGGGVELFVKNGQIRIVNTLENRLDLATQQILPAIRNTLFGVTGTRAFFD